MIFVDSNIPMYLVGGPHPGKTAARMLVERAVVDRERLVTDAEVLQEILHRYTAIRRRDAIDPCFAALLGIVDVVLPVTVEDALTARDVLASHVELSARDAIHLAVMRRHDVRVILSLDRGFDGLDGVERRVVELGATGGR